MISLFFNYFKRNKFVVLGVIACCCIALALHLYKIHELPMCLNSDEASFGYNAYSILKTGRDEYGHFMPVRFLAFGEYKFPVYIYLSVPFIAVFGLNDMSIRMLPIVLSILFPIILFILAEKLFQNKYISLLAAFLISLSPWFQIMSRQAHEDVLVTFCITCAALFFVDFMKKRTTVSFALFSLFNMLALFSYHIGRVFAVAFTLYLIYYVVFQIKKRTSRQLFVWALIWLVPLGIFLYSDLHALVRLNNLVFYKDKGFELTINELRGEHNNRILHNKFTAAVTVLSSHYMQYFSPQFLTQNGDENPRFGYSGLSPITLTEYTLFFVGLYFLFQNKEKERIFVLFLLLVSPLSASISWAPYSLTRSFYLIIPFILIVAYGYYYLVLSLSLKRDRLFVGGFVAISFFYFLIFSWDFYFNHYPQRPLAIRAWECGYKEVAEYIKANDHTYDKYVISRANGQPYIFVLFYLQYPPQKYQKQASLTKPDIYGFGQVERFDKYSFNFSYTSSPRTAFIGAPADLQDIVSREKAQIIKRRDEELFWIYPKN